MRPDVYNVMTACREWRLAPPKRLAIMTDETLPPHTSGIAPKSAFLPDVEREDTHIVDVLIEERCPELSTHWTWPVVRPILYKILGYGRARKMADEIIQMTGREAFDDLTQKLKVDLSVTGLERLPKTGRVVVVANHPTGLADGIAVWDLLSRVRKDIVFLANADAVRVNSKFQDVIIPVEWVADKRSPAKTRETLRRAAEAFEEEMCVVIFPSGRLASRMSGKLTEKDWFSTAVSLARKRGAPIAPLNIDAKNSALFYALSRLSGELRDITLFQELLNKGGAPFRTTFGPIIPSESLSGDAGALTDQLKNYVSYTLLSDTEAKFSPLN
jgi:putative hemolysin